MSSSSFQDQLILLPPNRVWRTYQGGATLDRLAATDTPTDSHWAEDWIGSITAANNPGRESGEEGISRVRIGAQEMRFDTLLNSDPNYFLGADHVARHGVSPMLLIKYLDSAIRLHFQCHPSPEFARRHLNSPSGKTEAYHVLGIREDEPNPYIYVGFQHPPTAEALAQMVSAQDVAALEACFTPIPVKPGDTFLIPGGVPHALGPGIFMIEIQEPTDFAVRFENERGGYVLPESARYMGRDIDFAVSLVDFTAYPADDCPFRCTPRPAAAPTDGSRREVLIGPDQTACFRVERLTVPTRTTVRPETFSINIVTSGRFEATVAGRTVSLETFDKFFLPAGLECLELRSIDGPACLVSCLPPA